MTDENINEDDISQIADLLGDVKYEVGFQYCDERDLISLSTTKYHSAGLR